MEEGRRGEGAGQARSRRAGPAGTARRKNHPLVRGRRSRFSGTGGGAPASQRRPVAAFRRPSVTPPATPALHQPGNSAAIHRPAVTPSSRPPRFNALAGRKSPPMHCPARRMASDPFSGPTKHAPARYGARSSICSNHGPSSSRRSSVSTPPNFNAPLARKQPLKPFPVSPSGRNHGCPILFSFVLDPLHQD